MVKSETKEGGYGFSKKVNNVEPEMGWNFWRDRFTIEDRSSKIRSVLQCTNDIVYKYFSE